MRTKRALPRISRAADRNASESAHPRRDTAKNARCDRHFWRRQHRHGALRHPNIERPTANSDHYGWRGKRPNPPPWCLLIPPADLPSIVSSSTGTSKNYLTSSELSLNFLSVTAKADIMSFRFERQTPGRPAHADSTHLPLEQADRQRFAAASSGAEYAVRRRHSEKRPAERAERALTRKRRRNQWGADVQTDGGNWRKPAETPRMTATASRLSALELTQS
jgi:hypothetical protein